MSLMKISLNKNLKLSSKSMQLKVMKAVLDNNHLYLWLFNQMFKTKTIGKTFINKLIKFSPAIIGNINRKKMIKMIGKKLINKIKIFNQSIIGKIFID